jgi:UTP--glucose-1-phosphate uridylyltransferase
MSITKVVIPVAGDGTRMLPVSKSLPKEMLPVGRKPAVQYVVEEAIAAGLRQVLFITGRMKSAVADYFDIDVELERKLAEAGKRDLLEDMAFHEANVTFMYVRQSAPRGLADAVATARDFVGNDPFVLCLGDTMVASEENGQLLRRLIESHQRHGSDATVAVEPVSPEALHHYGVIKVKDESASPLEIVDVVEKPPADQAPSNLTVASRYVFNPDIFEAIDATVPDIHTGALELTESLRVLIRRGKTVHGVRLEEDETRCDVGSFPAYFKAFVDFALEDEKYGYLLRQHLYRKLQQ